jgi:cytochrome P450 family 4
LYVAFLITILVSTWRVHRKIINQAFNMRILESFVEIFAEQSSILIGKLENELNREEFDVSYYISRCVLDFVCGEIQEYFTS